MSDQPTNQNEKTEKRNRGVGGLSRFPLRKVIELANTVFSLGNGDPVSRTLAFDRLGKSATSGQSNQLVATANLYGLVKPAADRLELTERAKTILTAANERIRYDAIYEALFGVSAFETFINRYKEKPMPLDEIAIDYFVREQSLPKTDAEEFWTVTKNNLLEYKLTQDLLSGKKMVLSREKALEQFKATTQEPSLQDENQIDDGNGFERLSPSNVRQIMPSRRMLPNMKPGAEFHFNIQIHLPTDAKPEVYDAIFKSIATHLLGSGANE